MICSTDSRSFSSRFAITRSGESENRRSRWRFLVPPTTAFVLRQCSGLTQNFVIPTTRSSSPKSKSHSVSEGTKQTMRCGGAAMLMDRARPSVKIRGYMSPILPFNGKLCQYFPCYDLNADTFADKTFELSHGISLEMRRAQQKEKSAIWEKL